MRIFAATSAVASSSARSLKPSHSASGRPAWAARFTAETSPRAEKSRTRRLRRWINGCKEGLLESELRSAKIRLSP